jgi:hypothetical protein
MAMAPCRAGEVDDIRERMVVCGQRQERAGPVNIWARTEDQGQHNLGTEHEEAHAGFFLQKLARVGASFGRAYVHLRACISPGTTVVCVKWTPAAGPLSTIISLTDARTPSLASSPTTVQMHMEMHSVVGNLSHYA